MEYGKESLKKYRKLLFEAEIKKNEKQTLTRDKKYLKKNSHDRYAFSNEKIQKRINTTEKGP